MKRFLLFTMAIFMSSILYAQFEIPQDTQWTGAGDGQTWDDEQNWLDGIVPEDGDNILIDTGHPIYIGSPFVFGSVSVTSGANLFLNISMVLTGDFTVDENSTLGVVVDNLSEYSKIETEGDYYFDGFVQLYFSTYVPQLGNQYYIINGNEQSCTGGSILSSETINAGFEVTLSQQCNGSAVIFTVTGINYNSTVKVWDGEAGDNLWDSPTNWNPDGVPTITNNVVINLVPGTNVFTSSENIFNSKSSTSSSQSKINASTAEARILMIGDGNTLTLNGGLHMFSVINNTESGTLVWNAGEISRTDTNVQSFLFNYGNTILNSSDVKEIGNGFGIYNYGKMNLNQGNLNINTGSIYNFNNAEFNINDDNITVSYTSGSLHQLFNYGESVIKKTAGSGTSTINLPEFTNYALVSSEQGTLSIPGNYNSFGFGSLNGSGTIQLPVAHMETGRIAPGRNYGVGGSKFGILTFTSNLSTNSSTKYDFQLDGLNPGISYDQIVVLGDAILDGTINVELTFAPPLTAVFEVLKANNLVSCNFPAQITASFDGTPFVFDVVCQNNTLYLKGPGGTLEISDIETTDLKIYPNPVNNVLNIKISNQLTGNWQLFNQLGQKVLMGNLEGIETKINTSKLMSGFYALQIKDTNNNVIKVKKVIVSN